MAFTSLLPSKTLFINNYLYTIGAGSVTMVVPSSKVRPGSTPPSLALS